MSQPGHDFWEVPDSLFVTREGEKAHFTPSGPAAKSPDLRAFLLSAFLQMAMGVALSAATATLVAVDPALQAWLVGPTGLSWTGWIVMLAPLGLVILLGARVEQLSGGGARMIFLGYAGLVGLSLGTVFLGMAPASVAVTSLAAAAGFCALAMVGARTGRDLSGLGSFFTIALVGFVCVALVNIVVRSMPLDLGLSAIGILLFAGLTAYDMQRLKRIFDERRPEVSGSIAVLGALTLYLDFINLFLSLIRFTGRHR